MRTIIGIDYSMTSPGLCVLNDNVAHLYSFCDLKVALKSYKLESLFRGNLSFTILPNVKTYKSQIERFDTLASKVLTVINNHELNDPCIYMEGYSMGSKGQVFNIAENTGILKHYLFKAGLDVHDVAPTTLKKFATGSGKAKKEDMHDAFMKHNGINLRELLTPNRKLGSPVSDLIDVYYVALYGKEQQGNEKSKEGGLQA